MPTKKIGLIARFRSKSSMDARPAVLTNATLTRQVVMSGREKAAEFLSVAALGSGLQDEVDGGHFSSPPETYCAGSRRPAIA
jgi:hypothetical protein